jgi:glycosyltransferase involved in cell wall biosynthesis
MSRVRFLYLMTEGLDETVIDSQVVDGLVAVARHGITFDLLSLTSLRDWFRRRAYYRERADAIGRRTGGAVTVVPNVRARGSVGAALGALRLLVELRRSGADRLVVHARGDRAAYFASLAARRSRRIRYVFDARGDGEAEFRLEGRERNLDARTVEAEVRRVRAVRAGAVAGAAHVLSVSTVLRDRIAAAHGAEPERLGVVPCVADAGKFHLDEAERAATRRELGLADAFVIVYAGRFGRWHFGRETCAVVAALMAADASAHFLVLTPDVDAARALADELLPPGRATIRSAAHAEIPRFLRAADLAMLLRAPDPLNEVACPTKFAEYVMSGLPVLISAGIGDCSGFVAEHAAGAVLAEPDPARAVAAVASLRAEPADRRRARIAAAAEVLSRDRYAGTVAALLRRVAEAP